MPGFPIRTPWDHSLVDSSPRPIAASHVLHRLLVPRHPPFALDNLTTKMLASTMQISTNNQPTTPQPHTSHQEHNLKKVGSPARYVRPGHAWTVLKQQPLAPQDHTVVLSGPNRVLIISRQPHRHQPFPPTPSPKGCSRVLGVPAVAARKLASVSAIEHPTTTCGQCGLLDDFRRLVAP